MSELPDDIERFFVHQELGKTGDNRKYMITCPYAIKVEGQPVPRREQWRVTWSISGTEYGLVGEAGLEDRRQHNVNQLKKVIRQDLRAQNARLELKGDQLWLIPNEPED